MNCNNDRNMLSEYKVGYAFVINQKLKRLYTPQKALDAGTIFPELDLTIGEYERGLYDGK